MLTRPLKKTKSFYVLTFSLFFWIATAIFAICFWEYDNPRSFIMLLYLLKGCALFIAVGYREIQQEKINILDNTLLSSSPPNKEINQLLFTSRKNFLRLSIVTFYILLALLTASTALILYDFINNSMEYDAFLFIGLELFFINHIIKDIKRLRQNPV